MLICYVNLCKCTLMYSVNGPTCGHTNAFYLKMISCYQENSPFTKIFILTF